jgi:hypothetical protein
MEVEEEGVWINRKPTAAEDIPQELRDWAVSAGSGLDDPMNQEWYELPLVSPFCAMKVIQHGPRTDGRTTSEVVPLRHVPMASGGTCYYAGQDAPTGIVYWGATVVRDDDITSPA